MHQHARIGMFAMVGGASAVDADVIPYGLVAGNRASLRGINLVGLRRAGRDTFSIGQIKFLIAAQRYLFTVVNDFGTSRGKATVPKRSSLVPCPFVLPQHELLEERALELRRAIGQGLRLSEKSKQHRGTGGDEARLALHVLDAIQGRNKVLMQRSAL